MYDIIKRNLRFTFYLFLYFTFLFLFCGSIAARAIHDGRHFVQVKSQNNLLGNSIKTITQNYSGFLCVGSENGLCLFDGYSFNPLRAIEDDSGDSPTNNFVKKVFQDSHNRLWIGMTKGACIYNDSSQLLEYLSPFENVFVHTFREDNNHNIWIGSDLGLCILSKDRKQLHFITADECQEMVGKRVNFISRSKQGDIWVFSEEGLHRITILEEGTQVADYDFSKNQTLSITNFPVKGRIGFFYIDPKDQAWIGIDNQVYRIPLPDKQLDLNNAELICNNEEALCLYQESGGNILIGTRNQGIIYLKMNEKGNICFRKTFWVNPQHIHDISNTVNTLFVDKWGNLWAGTENGLYVSKEIDTSRFFTLKENSTEETPSQNIISTLYQDSEKNIWMCTAYGLNKFNWVDKSNHEFIIKHYFDERDKQSMMQNNRFQSIIEKEKGIFWLSCKDRVIAYNASTETFFEDIKLKEFVKKHNLKLVRNFYRDKKNNIWLAFATGGLAVYIPDKDEFFLLGSVDEELKDEDYWAITEDARNYLWIGTRKSGLYKLKVDVRSFLTGDHPVTYKKRFLTNEWITSIYINRDNVPWIGTSNKIFKYDAVHEDFHQIQISTRSNNSIYVSAILEDLNDKLWIFTTNGIYRYDEPTQKSEYYDVHNGNLSRTNYLFGHLLSEDGTIFLGGINGLTYYFPENIKIDTIQQEILITDFQILNKHVFPDDRSVLKENINLQNSLTLAHTDYQFAFEFSTLYLTDPYKITYSYRLDGFDKEWIYVNARRNYASYSNLSPGNYTFRVRSTNASGVWLDNEKTIQIKILPSPWGSWWAYSLYLITFLGLMSFILHIFSVKNKYKEKEKVNRWKNQLYQTIIQGFETPLFLLRAPLDNLLSGFQTHTNTEVEGMLKIMDQNVKRLSLRTKQLMDFQKIELEETTLEISQVEMISFIRNIYDLFQPIAQTKNIRFDYQHEEDSLMLNADVEKIEIVLFNLLSNAFKYTPENGMVIVRCYRDIEHNQVQLEIRDNGIGIDKKYQERIFQSFYQINKDTSSVISTGAGLGLTLAKNYIQLHEGKLTVESSPGKGSVFSFFIPIDLPVNRQMKLSASVVKSLSGERMSYMEDYIEVEKTLEGENDKSLSIHHSSPLLFIVEKKPDLRHFFEKIMLKQGYRVKIVNLSEEFIQSIITQEPTLILFDIETGSKEELMLCRKIKDNIQTCHIPIVLLMENNYGENSKMEGYEYGADACIAKPFDISYLLIRIKHLIDIRNSIKTKLKFDETIYPEKEKSQTTSLDQKFIDTIMKIVEKNMADEKFNLEEFARQAGTSRSVLNTRVQSLLGQTPIEFVKTMRLKKAAQLIESNAYSITEISIMVGFTDLSYFSTCFKKQFGKKPSEYLKDWKKKDKEN